MKFEIAKLDYRVAWIEFYIARNGVASGAAQDDLASFFGAENPQIVSARRDIRSVRADADAQSRDTFYVGAQKFLGFRSP